MKYINGTSLTLILFTLCTIYSSVDQTVVNAIRINGDDAAPKKEEPAAAAAAPAEAKKDEAPPKNPKVKEGEPSESEQAAKEAASPQCVLEGKKCRDAPGIKPLDTSDEDVLPPKGMTHTPASLVAGSEAEKASKGESKELKKNATVRVDMIKMIPNKAKLARIAERKRREEEEKKKKEEELKKNATAKAAAQKAAELNVKKAAEQLNTAQKKAEQKIIAQMNAAKMQANATATAQTATNSTTPTPVPVAAVSNNTNVAVQQQIPIPAATNSTAQKK